MGIRSAWHVLRRLRKPKPSGFVVSYYMDITEDCINTIRIYIRMKKVIAVI